MSNEEILEENQNVTDETSETASDADPQVSVEELQQQLEQARSKAEENWDLLVRTKAEMENLRRRAERDVENAHKYALERFITELLPVKDSLELGVQAAQQENASVDKLQEGTELTLNMLNQAFDKFSINEVHPEGEPFNPDHHQAMAMLEHEEAAPNTVLQVMQKGYLLNDRLIRPAMVTVSKAVDKKSTNNDENS